MPLSTIDPHTALMIIDLQKGLAALPTVHPMQDVIAHTAALAAAFRESGQPVVLVTVAGVPAGRTEQPRRTFTPPEGWTDLIPELAGHPEDHRVTKHTPGAFTGTGLETWLRQAGVTQIVLAGIATSNGVEVTGRQAYELGFNVAFAIDAMTDLSSDAHDYSVGRVFPKIGETAIADTIIHALEETM